MRVLLLAGAALLVLNSCSATVFAAADDSLTAAPVVCDPPTRTLADDKAAALKGGMTYLGTQVLPFTGTLAVFYTQDGETYLSMVFEGCVEAETHDVGAYVAEPDI